MHTETAHDVARRLDPGGPHRPAAPEYRIPCPAHGGTGRNLSLRDRDDGEGVVATCHSRGCAWEDIRRALFGERAAEAPGGRAPAYDALHHYRAADGRTVFRVSRLGAGKGKTIRPWPGGSGWRKQGLPSERPLPLYRLPELEAADASLVVAVVEGEKDADALAQAVPNRPVTTWHGGASETGAADKWARHDWRPLAGRKVVLLADRNSQGRATMRALAQHLHGIAGEVTLVAAEGDDGASVLEAAEGDLKDYIAAHRADYDPEAERHLPGVPLPPRRSVEWAWPGWLPRGNAGVVVLSGPQGSGKGLVVARLAAALAGACALPDGAGVAQPGSTFWVSYEDVVAEALAPRLEHLGYDAKRHHPIRFHDGAEPGGDPAGELDRILDMAATMPTLRLLVIDPVSELLARAGASENDNAELLAVLGKLRAFARRMNCSVLLPHHNTKPGPASAARSPMYRIRGGQALTSSPRMVWALEHNRREAQALGETRLLARVKSNVSGIGNALRLAVRLGDAPEDVRLDYSATIEGSGPVIIDKYSRGEHDTSPAERREAAADLDGRVLAWLDEHGAGTRAAVASACGTTPRLLRSAEERLAEAGELVVTTMPAGKAREAGHEVAGKAPEVAVLARTGF